MTIQSGLPIVPPGAMVCCFPGEVVSSGYASEMTKEMQ